MVWAAEDSGVTGTLGRTEELAATGLTTEIAPIVDDAAAEVSSVQVEVESGCAKLPDPRDNGGLDEWASNTATATAPNDAYVGANDVTAKITGVVSGGDKYEHLIVDGSTVTTR